MNYISPDYETDHARLLRVKELITFNEVAEILGISIRSVWAMVQRGELDKVKISGSARITTESVREMVYGWKYEEEEGERRLSGMSKPRACN